MAFGYEMQMLQIYKYIYMLSKCMILKHYPTLEILFNAYFTFQYCLICKIW